MGAIVQFDFGLFARSYPQLAGIGEPMAEQFFTIAQDIHRNDGGGPIGNPVQQLNLLNMVVAHLAQLYAPRDGSGNPSATGTAAPTLPGRISSATEGSVSVQTEALTAFNTAQAQYFSQTTYGQLYWAATAFARTGRYRPFYDVRQATH